MNSTTETSTFYTTTDETNLSQQVFNATISGVLFVLVGLGLFCFTSRSRARSRDASSRGCFSECFKAIGGCFSGCFKVIGGCFSVCFMKCQTCFKTIADMDCRCQWCKRITMNTEAPTPTRDNSSTRTATTSSSIQTDNPHLEGAPVPPASGPEPPPYPLDLEVAPPTYSVAMRDVTVYQVRETGSAESPPPRYDVIFCAT
ncbi:uncharacterized protein LOC128244995 [Mya arenaria]|uniref:uncharacterized protein LOC128244995 n=1 Tax=Mya arenaria TaxID=6604 RepID=UPI0022E0ACEF|nr:uncharacterized protein LOC128244995 [Mya arenaria]